MKYLVLRWKRVIGDVRGEVGVIDGTEGETVGPAAAEIGDVDILQGERREKTSVMSCHSLKKLVKLRNFYANKKSDDRHWNFREKNTHYLKILAVILVLFLWPVKMSSMRSPDIVQQNVFKRCGVSWNSSTVSECLVRNCENEAQQSSSYLQSNTRSMMT